MGKKLDEEEQDTVGLLASRYVEKYPWADKLAIEICFRVSFASNAQTTANQRVFRAVGREEAIGRVGVLRTLYFSPDKRLSQMEIGNDVRVTAANVTYLVDALEKQGLVVRVGNPSDRRSSYVELTKEGCDACEVLLPAMAEHMTRIASSFSEEEKRLFIAFLERFQNSEISSYLDMEEVSQS